MPNGRRTSRELPTYSALALLAQEKLKLPVATVHLQPSVMWSDHEPPALGGMFGPRWLRSILFRIGERFFVDPVFCAHLNPWRKELGLPPVRKITRWWNSPRGVVSMFPAWYAADQPDWPRPHLQTDFPLWNHQTTGELPPEIAQFVADGAPPLVFTPGSANVHGRGFFQAGAESCQTLGRRGIFLTEFPEQLPPNLPESILHVKYVPLDLLLPRAAAFLHHGGIGSTSQAMLAGIPQVAMPLAHDQFDNVARIRRLNVGDGLPGAQFTGSRLTPILKRLLESRDVAAACQGVSARLQARDGLSRSADAVESLLTGQVAASPATSSA